MIKCCICGKEIEDYGNNTQPYCKGLCCDECNNKYVIPYRLKLAVIESYPGEE